MLRERAPSFAECVLTAQSGDSSRPTEEAPRTLRLSFLSATRPRALGARIPPGQFHRRDQPLWNEKLIPKKERENISSPLGHSTQTLAVKARDQRSHVFAFFARVSGFRP